MLQVVPPQLVLQGSATAPIRQQASSVSTHSIRFPTSVITTSPRLTPRAAKAPESPAEQAISSPKYQSRRFASASTATIPSREAGDRSIRVLDQVHGAAVCLRSDRAGARGPISP